MLVVNMILGTTNIPWRLQRDIGKIQEKVTQHGIKVQHCYREGNHVADSLAKYATTLDDECMYFDEADLPSDS